MNESAIKDDLIANSENYSISNQVVLLTIRKLEEKYPHIYLPELERSLLKDINNLSKRQVNDLYNSIITFYVESKVESQVNNKVKRLIETKPELKHAKPSKTTGQTVFTIFLWWLGLSFGIAIVAEFLGFY